MLLYRYKINVSIYLLLIGNLYLRTLNSYPKPKMHEFKIADMSYEIRSCIV